MSLTYHIQWRLSSERNYSAFRKDMSHFIALFLWLVLLWQFLPSEIHILSSKETGAGQKERDREIRNNEEREKWKEKKTKPHLVSIAMPHMCSFMDTSYRSPWLPQLSGQSEERPNCATGRGVKGTVSSSRICMPLIITTPQLHRTIFTFRKL